MKNVLKVVLLIAVALFSYSASVFSQGVQSTSVIKAKLMARNGAIMVDVREPSEIKALAYDVEGIKTIPLGQLKERMGEIPKDKEIILACRSGKRSMRAAKMLVANGYKNVYNMNGGIIAWSNKGLETLKNGEKKVTKSCCSKGSKKACTGKTSTEAPAKKACCASKDSKKSCTGKKH